MAVSSNVCHKSCANPYPWRCHMLLVKLRIVRCVNVSSLVTAPVTVPIRTSGNQISVPGALE